MYTSAATATRKLRMTPRNARWIRRLPIKVWSPVYGWVSISRPQSDLLAYVNGHGTAGTLAALAEVAPLVGYADAGGVSRGLASLHKLELIALVAQRGPGGGVAAWVRRGAIIRRQLGELMTAALEAKSAAARGIVATIGNVPLRLPGRTTVVATIPTDQRAPPGQTAISVALRRARELLDPALFPDQARRRG